MLQSQCGLFGFMLHCENAAGSTVVKLYKDELAKGKITVNMSSATTSYTFDFTSLAANSMSFDAGERLAFGIDATDACGDFAGTAVWKYNVGP